MVGSYVSVIVLPLIVPVTTVAPVGKGVRGAGFGGEEAREVEGEADASRAEESEAKTTEVVVGQLPTDGCIVYAAHPIVVVPERV